MEAPDGLCATCRWVTSELRVYPVPPAAVVFYCAIKAAPWPRMPACPSYEREPGAD